MKKIILAIVILGYGFKIEFWNHGKGFGEDGSLSKFGLEKKFSKYSNPYICLHFFYRFDLIFRLVLNRG
jgi:hypothetical protein